jgi:hypothetical protein
MFGGRNLLSGSRKYLYGLLLLTFICLISVAFTMTGSDEFDWSQHASSSYAL